MEPIITAVFQTLIKSETAQNTFHMYTNKGKKVQMHDTITKDISAIVTCFQFIKVCLD